MLAGAEPLESLAELGAVTQLLSISCPELSVVVLHAWEGSLGRGAVLVAADVLALPLVVMATFEELGEEPGNATEVAKVVAVAVTSEAEAALSAARIFLARESMAAVSKPNKVSYQ